MILTTYDKGVEVGYDKGKVAGKAEGKCEALQGMVIRLASRQCGAPNEEVRKQIEQIEDVARLQNLVEAAFTAQSWEQLLAVK